MAILENESLKVSIRNKGAELISVFDKSTHTEHLWQGDPKFWGWHAPNLFPVVGGCLKNQIQVNGKAYLMERHGFARQSEFTLVEASPSQAVFSLQSNPHTLTTYPYHFEFQVIYALSGRKLKVTYRVRNKGQETMYFSVGAHPAFNVPFSPGENYSDYYLEFEQEEKLERHLLASSGLFNGKTEVVPLQGNKLSLSQELFNKDALVFKNISSRIITLRSKNHNQSIKVAFQDFPYLGIWAKPGASFVCIEPWLGCADTEGKAVDISQKEAIQNLKAGGIFEKAISSMLPNPILWMASFTIQIGE